MGGVLSAVGGLRFIFPFKRVRMREDAAGFKLLTAACNARDALSPCGSFCVVVGDVQVMMVSGVGFQVSGSIAS
jgi:hypothetical protein